MAPLHIPFGGACRNLDPTLSRRIQTLKLLANPGGMPRWRNELRHWLTEGFRYAAQAAAMREGHLWDITPRAALREHGGKSPLGASRLDVTTGKESLGPRTRNM